MEDRMRMIRDVEPFWKAVGKIADSIFEEEKRTMPIEPLPGDEFPDPPTPKTFPVINSIGEASLLLDRSLDLLNDAAREMKEENYRPEEIEEMMEGVHEGRRALLWIIDHAEKKESKRKYPATHTLFFYEGKSAYHYYQQGWRTSAMDGGIGENPYQLSQDDPRAMWWRSGWQDHRGRKLMAPFVDSDSEAEKE